MQIWYELDQAGQAGLTFDEVLEKVSPRVPAGWAWRRYNRQRQAQRRYDDARLAPRSDRASTTAQSDVPDTPHARTLAVRYAVRSCLAGMVAGGTGFKRPDGHFVALRKPKSVFTDEQHDFDGSVTHKSVALMEFLRVARPFVERIEAEWLPSKAPGHMPHIPVTLYAALTRLVEAHTKTQ
jgi:hypothetical protein